MKKIKKEDILSIKPGYSKTFAFDDARALASARSYIYQFKRLVAPDGISRYKTRANYGSNTLFVEAIACGE